MPDETEIISNFLRVSGAYLFSCAYRDSLRAAYARRAAEDAIAEHERRFRELLVREAVCLVRTQWEEDAALIAARIADREIPARAGT
jgi:hypothetical protein